MKKAVFWGLTPCGSCKIKRSSETSVITGAKQHNILEDGISKMSFVVTPIIQAVAYSNFTVSSIYYI
jgi:hypothetical protein